MVGAWDGGTEASERLLQSSQRGRLVGAGRNRGVGR